MLSTSNFKTSVNIKFDIGDKEFVDRYLPTPSHAEAIIGLSDGFVAPDNNAAHIMIGPYGSGKSLVATIIANFISGSIQRGPLDELTSKFDKVHQGVHESLIKLSNIKRKYIPVTISGSEGTFANTVINSILTSLRNEGIKFYLPNKRSEIEEIIKTWSKDYQNTYEQFLQKLVAKNTSYKKWILKVNRGNTREIAWFKSIYPSLTAGAAFQIDNNDNFLEQINFILEQLEERNIGIFIIYDEFGRFLQNLDYAEVYKTMQDIQDLAEVANRSKQFLHVLLISHKNMSQYMIGLYNDYHSEFLRIEKRFSTYFIESDTATYFRFVENFIRSNIPVSSQQKVPVEESLLRLRKFNLFEELNQQELEKLVVESTYPIHPITLFLLPRLSKVYGQNERTLFTFLENKDAGGLLNHIRNNDNYYYPDQLFSYFFPDHINNSMTKNDGDLNIIRTFSNISSKFQLTEENKNAYRILQIVTLWQLSHSNSVYRMDSDLLSFALMIPENEVTVILDRLTTMKFIRFNRVLKQWELIEGSSVQIDSLIADTLPTLTVTKHNRLSYLTKHLSHKHLIANKYNVSKNITRFFKIKLILSSSLLQKNMKTSDLLSDEADGFIYFVLLEKSEHYQKILKKSAQLKSDFLMFSILTTEFNHIKNTVDKNITIEHLMTDKNLLSDYKNLNEELFIISQEHSYQIQSFLKLFLSFQSNSTWIHNGNKIVLQELVDLKDYISDIMTKNYNETPVIMNDSINRKRVVGIQKTSLLKVLNHILNDSTKENLNIEGQGPDYLIYATLVKNLEINFKHLDKIGNPNVLLMRKNLISIINKNKNGSVKALKEALQQSPFGIREPLIPIFIVMLLRDLWEQIIFYKNNMFVPALDAEKIYEIFESPEDYEYEYHHYSKTTTKFLNYIDETFNQYISEYVVDETPLIRASSGLLNWLRSLPRQTQITNDLSNELLSLKEIIRRSEINPLQSIEELKEKYSKKLSTLDLHIEEMQNAFEEFSETVLSQLLTKLSITGFIEKNNYIEEYSKETIYNNRLLHALSESDNFSDFITNYIGVELSHWSDTTKNLFLSQVDNDIALLSKDNGNLFGDSDKIKITVNNSYKEIENVDLSRKSEIILNNVDRMIKNAGRTVSTDEVNVILYKLMKTYLK